MEGIGIKSQPLGRWDSIQVQEKNRRRKDKNKEERKKRVWEEGFGRVTGKREKDEWPSLEGAILIYIVFFSLS